jgi:hypothetical protein
MEQSVCLSRSMLTAILLFSLGVLEDPLLLVSHGLHGNTAEHQ